MENASLFSPANPHFFKPLLSSSQSHFNIPVKFFSEHIEGKHEGKTVSLRSDALAKTWKVKMEGQGLTEGWKEFVKAHDLRVGDFLVFRHEGDMLFNVTALGPSCCEIQYARFGCRHKDKEEEDEDETERSDKETEDNNLPTCFSQYVTVFSMTRDTVSLPSAFAKRNGLYEVSQKIVLMNEGGRSWPSELKKLESGRIVIVRGWTSFCIANKFQVGDSWTFKLLRNAETPVFQLCSRAKTERKNKETLSKEANIAERTDENKFVKLTPTLNSLERGKQHLPLSFTSVNDLIKPEKVILVDKNGDEWVMDLKVDNRSGLIMCIMSVNGWKSFCAVNEVGAEESLTLELILGAASPVLKFCSKMEQSPLEPAEARAHKRARVQTCIQEIRPKLEIREETAEEGEPSHRTRASDKTITNRGNLRETLPSSIPNQLMNKVKHSVLCTLTSIRLFREELKTMEQKLEDSLKDIDNLGNVV